MASPAPGKRRSEQATSEPRKRQRTEPDPESLYTQVKTLSQRLLNRLNRFLRAVPDNDSTKADRQKILFMQTLCEANLDAGEITQKLANMLEIDLETDFLLARANQGNTHH